MSVNDDFIKEVTERATYKVSRDKNTKMVTVWWERFPAIKATADTVQEARKLHLELLKNDPDVRAAIAEDLRLRYKY